jgi:hypothetical protein
MAAMNAVILSKINAGRKNKTVCHNGMKGENDVLDQQKKK